MYVRLASFLMVFGCFLQLFSQKKSVLHGFEFRTDNDSYLAEYSDRYYTNGMFFTFFYALDPKKIKNPSIIKKIVAFQIGHRMYIPQSGYVPRLRYVDRPFAAYLYAQGAILVFYENEQVFKYSSEIGIMGPHALGKEIQTNFHRVFGFYEIDGWKYQLEDELGFNLSLAYTKLLFRKKPLDLMILSDLKLGTLFSEANLGCLLRIGWFSPLYHSLINNSRIGYPVSGGMLQKKPEYFFFIKSVLKYVAYDASIQGGFFRKYKGPVLFEPEPFVFSQDFGFGFTSGDWMFEASTAFNTKEVQSWAKRHQWGSLRVVYAF